MHSTTERARGPEPGADPGHQHRNRPVSSDLGDLSLLGLLAPVTALPRTPKAVLALQAAAGNAAVSDLLGHARLIPSVQREDAATDAATEAPDINAQYQAAVRASDWARAAVVLNGFNDTDLANRVKALNAHRIELRLATPPWATRVIRAILDAEYTAAATFEHWGEAAELLNGYSDADINDRIRDLKPVRRRIELFAAAAAWNNRVMGAIAQIDRDAAYQGSIKRDDWARAAEILNDFKDLARRVKSMTSADRKRIREAAPASAARVIWTTLDFDYGAAINGKQWIEAAELLNAFNDEDIYKRLKDLTPAKQIQLMIGARQSPLIGPGDRIINKINNEPGNIFGAVDFSQLPHHAKQLNGYYWCDFRIEFTPDPTVAVCPNIGFLQSHNVYKHGTNASRLRGQAADRPNAKGEAIDRFEGAKHGWIGLKNDGTPSEKGTLQPGISLGKKVVPAKFFDPPGDYETDMSFNFETSIVAREGPQANLVYAVVHWGFEVDIDGHISEHSVKIVDRPTDGFATAIDAWNAQAAGKSPTVTGQEPLPVVH